MIDNFSNKEIDDIHKTIGLNVKKAREEAKLSQLELSLKMGLKSVSLVSSAELYTNKKHFNIEHLYKIAKICNKNINEFFKDIQTTTKKL